jgi:hypothetical protein
MNLVTRAQWGARPRKGNPTPLRPTGATAHWEGPHMGTFPHASCPAKVRGIQAFHMDARGWSDIAYNAVVCPHGYVFEGRGRGVRSAANGTNVGNDADGAVCYLGGEGDPFTPEGAAAMADALHWLSPGGQRHAHRDWKPTTCPGDTIAAWVHSPAALTPGAPTTGGFGTMDDSKILDEFANVTTRTGAQITAATDKLHDQAQRHNENRRQRDEQIIDLLERIAVKIGA